MEPFFLLCLSCHNARVWHHRDEIADCPNGCEAHHTIPWFDGFGPDEAPVPRHRSHRYGDGSDRWPESREVAFHVNNIAEMRGMCR